MQASDVSSVVSITANGGIATAGPNTEIIINGGNHQTDAATLYKADGGKIKINKGKFKSSDPSSLFTHNNGEINVIGGSFYQWNPLDYSPIYYKPASDDIIFHDKNDWYYIKKKIMVDPKYETENDAEKLREALKKEDTGYITLNSQVTTNKPFKIQNEFTFVLQILKG